MKIKYFFLIPTILLVTMTSLCRAELSPHVNLVHNMEIFPVATCQSWERIFSNNVSGGKKPEPQFVVWVEYKGTSFTYNGGTSYSFTVTVTVHVGGSGSFQMSVSHNMAFHW